MSQTFNNGPGKPDTSLGYFPFELEGIIFPTVGKTYRDSITGEEFKCNHIYFYPDYKSIEVHPVISMILDDSKTIERVIPLRRWCEDFSLNLWEVVKTLGDMEDINKNITIKNKFPDIDDIWYDAKYDQFLFVEKIEESSTDEGIKFHMQSIDSQNSDIITLTEWQSRAADLCHIPDY